VSGTLLHAFTRPARKNTTNRNLLRQNFILTSLGAREQERKSKSKSAKGKREQEREKEQEQEEQQEQEKEQESKKKNKNKKARERKSKNKREKKQEQEREKEWQNPVPFKENYPPPRMYYSLIGCSPSAQLSSRERQNTWRENCPCTCADYVYYLEHSCQRHLIMANVRAAPNRTHNGKRTISLINDIGKLDIHTKKEIRHIY
jgi:flagellar biosynthesis GTPase FlhF